MVETISQKIYESLVIREFIETLVTATVQLHLARPWPK